MTMSAKAMSPTIAGMPAKAGTPENAEVSTRAGPYSRAQTI